MSPVSNHNNRFKKRALMLQKVRDFFCRKNFLEIDVPMLLKAPSIDEHIDAIEAYPKENNIGYLHTSPEFILKRVLSEIKKDIYFLGHVFRKGEMGDIHNIEFTMAEWYRIGITYENFIKEIIEFIHLFLGPLPYKKQSYRELFLNHTNIDYTTASKKDLTNYINKKKIDVFSIEDLNKDDLLNLILTHEIEPHLGKDEIFILDKYPPTQAAFAKIIKENGIDVALRFEFYYQGIELGNGFFELLDPIEQKKRLIQNNIKREKLNKKSYPLDERFLSCLDTIPSCYGIAMGFDRLLMLKNKNKTLVNNLVYSFEEI